MKEQDSPGGFDTVCNGGGPSLPNVVRKTGEALWPTARSSGASLTGGSNQAKAEKARGTYISGRLNPAWVEALMGFPPGWTDGPQVPANSNTRGNRRARSPGSSHTEQPGSEPSATRSSRRARRSSAA